jgi:hypothetical protein
MCEETHYDCAVVDDAVDLTPFELVILPDSVVVTPELRRRLADYYAAGGKLLLSHNAGFDKTGQWALDFLPLQFHGDVEKYPTFWRTNPEFEPNLAGSDRVFYAQGKNVSGEGLTVLAKRVLPYFKRTDVTFSSHFQTPPVKEADEFPAIVAGERFVYFTDPIFREYRQTGNTTARDAWKAAVRRLVGAPPFGGGLPTTVLCVPRRRDNDLILTLLHYIPVRKALEIDVIEERMNFAGQTLRIAGAPAGARVFNGTELQKVEDGFALPAAMGRLLVEVPRYFGE